MEQPKQTRDWPDPEWPEIVLVVAWFGYMAWNWLGWFFAPPWA